MLSRPDVLYPVYRVSHSMLPRIGFAIPTATKVLHYNLHRTQATHLLGPSLPLMGGDCHRQQCVHDGSPPSGRVGVSEYQFKWGRIDWASNQNFGSSFYFASQARLAAKSQQLKLYKACTSSFLLLPFISFIDSKLPKRKNPVVAIWGIR